MDTFVPTAGYFAMALDKVDHTIQFYGPQLGEDALRFWGELKSCIEHDTRSSSRLAASYLNPVYFLQQLQKDPLLPADNLKKALKGLAERLGADADPIDIDKEVDGYGQVFISLSESIQLEDYHPVKLWEKVKAHELPVLRRCALVLLSRPLNCMGKQVERHLYDFDRLEDAFTTLNFRMMRHFQDLGGVIYKPLYLSELDYDKFKTYIVTNEPCSEQNRKSSSFGDLDDHGGLKKAQSRDPPPPPPVSSNAPISFPYIGVIPMSMRTHLIGYHDVKPDGNCGYRAIAQGLGFGQDQWQHIRKSMIAKLKEHQSLFERTFHFLTVDKMLLALNYFEQDFAPEDNWLSLPDMGCLVATTFNCAFVVLGSEYQTYLPMYLTEDQTNNLNIKTCICLLTENSHFISVTLSENSPLPPPYHMWHHHHHKSADLLIEHFHLRLM